MELSVTEKLQYSTVRIIVDLESGGLGTGTGFFFRLCENSDRHIPILVTNKHVVSGGAKGRFLMTTMAPDGVPVMGRYFTVALGDLDKIFVSHPDPQVDLAALPIAHLLQAANAQRLKLFYIPLYKSLIPTESEELELTAVEDVLMVGYPNGIWDSTNNLPVFRKGITATHPARNYEGRDEFMIDAACFPGSSGSPVLLYNIGSYATRKGIVVGRDRIKLLGILYAGPQQTVEGKIEIVNVPTENTPLAKSQIPINLGNVIKARRILDFESVLEKENSG